MPPLTDLPLRYSVDTAPFASGGMGDVWRAYDHRMRRPIAVKSLRPELLADHDCWLRMVRETEVIARLNHPGVCPIYCRYLDEDHPCYTMQLIDGVTLEDRMEDAPFPPDSDQERALLGIVARICETVAYAHGQGVVHRDLKPANVMVAELGEVYVMDWGLALVADQADPAGADTGGGAAFHTHDGAIIGTPAYMAPEQALGERPDERADVYALGAIVFHILTGRPPRESLAECALETDETADAAVAQTLLECRVPWELRQLLTRAMAADPGARHASVNALHRDLVAYLERRVLPGLRYGAWRRSWNRLRLWARRNPAGARIGIVVLLVLGGAGAVIWQLQAQRAAADEGRRMAALRGRAVRRARRIDLEVRRFEGLVRGLAAEVRGTLLRSAPDAQAALPGPELFRPAPGAKQVDDLRLSPRYGMPISVGWPVYIGDRKQADHVDVLRRLSRLRPVFRRLALDTWDPAFFARREEDLWRRVAVRGVPMVWAYFAHERTGAHVAYPGKGTYPADFAPRGRPWYRAAANYRRPRWQPPYVDIGGQGQVMACVLSVHDDQTVRVGRRLGVAGLDVRLEHFGQLVAASEDSTVGSWLVLPDGRIVLRAGERSVQDAAPGPDRWGLSARSGERFPIAEVVAQLAREDPSETRIDVTERHGRALVIQLVPLETLNWTLVVVAERQRLR